MAVGRCRIFYRLVNYPDISFAPADAWLARFAKLTVALTFFLIVIGGHTTTAGAGMAFPDWPLSHGSVNPDGWWENTLQRLEHGHRFLAEGVGLVIGILCAWVWRSKWSVPIALGGSALLAGGAGFAGTARPMVAHIGLWSSVFLFIVTLFLEARLDRQPRSASVRWLAFAAFLGVCVQAVLGGLRVIHDPAGVLTGSITTATALRVMHGCFAQVELCLLVALATMLSSAWVEIPPRVDLRGVARLGWVTAIFVFLQLIVGATMRHLGAGLAIPTWPLASPDGAWVPVVHNAFVDLNFTHTRVGALVVSVLTLLLIYRTLRQANGATRLVRPALLLFALLLAQVTVGVLVVWQGRPAVMTTLHVVNGAAVLATTLLLTLRAARASDQQRPAGAHWPLRRFVEVVA